MRLVVAQIDATMDLSCHRVTHGSLAHVRLPDCHRFEKLDAHGSAEQHVISFQLRNLRLSAARPTKQ